MKMHFGCFWQFQSQIWILFQNLRNLKEDLKDSTKIHSHYTINLCINSQSCLKRDIQILKIILMK